MTESDSGQAFNRPTFGGQQGEGGHGQSGAPHDTASDE